MGCGSWIEMQGKASRCRRKPLEAGERTPEVDKRGNIPRIIGGSGRGDVFLARMVDGEVV